MAKALTDIAIAKLKPGPVRREIPDSDAVALRDRAADRPPPLRAALSLQRAIAEGHASGRAVAGRRAQGGRRRGARPRSRRRSRRGAQGRQGEGGGRGADTVRAICGQYLAREGDKLRTRRQRERLLARHVYPDSRRAADRQHPARRDCPAARQDRGRQRQPHRRRGFVRLCVGFSIGGRFAMKISCRRSSAAWRGTAPPRMRARASSTTTNCAASGRPPNHRPASLLPA